jgi:hypothetical protein
MRIGKSPMTNLHLGSDRDDFDTFIGIVGDSNWQKMKHTCEAAAAVFPNSLYAGIDLLVYPDLQRHAIIEIKVEKSVLATSQTNRPGKFSVCR